MKYEIVGLYPGFDERGNPIICPVRARPDGTYFIIDRGQEVELDPSYMNVEGMKQLLETCPSEFFLQHLT
jgi:hypothetical protein